MKIIAMHLPQFHRIPENDLWWGEGFTEWTNVKAGRPLFEGHTQPRIPYNANYYDLTKRETRLWQANLAKSYGIYGFCYYHYWFNGKKLLEKPIEALLEDKSPDFPFCLSWANEPWSRSWEGKETQVLMPQDYGDGSDWKKHIQYLIRFFKDPRYIRVDGRPVFLVYRTSGIPNLDIMLAYWIVELRKAGIEGLYIIETLNSFQKEPCSALSDAVMEFEPMFTIKHDMDFVTKAKRLMAKKSGRLDMLDYDSVWNTILKRKRDYSTGSIIQSAFPGWDNSPRKGGRATIITGGNPKKFGQYLNALIQNTTRPKVNKEFLFINAWNEWAEGAYLEPDTANGFGYLEAIKQLRKEESHGYLNCNSYLQQ